MSGAREDPRRVTDIGSVGTPSTAMLIGEQSLTPPNGKPAKPADIKLFCILFMLEFFC